MTDLLERVAALDVQSRRDFAVEALLPLTENLDDLKRALSIEERHAVAGALSLAAAAAGAFEIQDPRLEAMLLFRALALYGLADGDRRRLAHLLLTRPEPPTDEISLSLYIEYLAAPSHDPTLAIKARSILGSHPLSLLLRAQAVQRRVVV